MYYFSCSLSYWGPDSKEQPVCSQARGARISTVSTIFAHHTKKAVCLADSLAYSRTCSLTKPAPGVC